MGCTREELGLVNSPREFESTSDTTLRVQVKFEVTVPRLTPQTKALGETPEGDLDKMYIAVFGRSGYLKEYVEASITKATTNGLVDETVKENGVLLNRYSITATLALSENSERHIHFLGNGPSSMEFGQETDLIPNLMSPEGKGGYWQYAVVPGIKAKRNRDIYTADYLDSHPDVDPDEFILQNGHYVLHDDTARYFADVPLIRNFSKIVVEDMAGSNFVTSSFAAINIATSGSFAPYYSAGFITNYQTKSYTDLRSTLKYPALLPLHATFNDYVPTSSAFENIGTGVAAKGGSVYMYERPIPDDDQKPTSVIIYGYYTDPDTEDGDNESGYYYYKVDLMDANGYYPIYRNFKYRIQIKEILRPGANSPEDAIRTMGSGDISADIATQNLTDISDGTSHILVSYMNKTLIHQYPHDTEQLTLLYKFIPDVNADTNNDGEADWNNNLEANGGPVAITLQTMTDNPVITNYTVAGTDDANGFRTITITTSAPTGYLRTQYIQIKGTNTVTHVDPDTQQTTTTRNSLYRNVTFSMISTQTMTVTCVPSRVAQEVGEEVTVNISIPKSLPSSMFPLVFNIEAEQLSLTPDNSKANNNLPVNSGTSIYGTGKPAFCFVRTVSEDEYIRLSDASTTTTVTIPCYFKTNKTESASNIRVIDQEGYFLTGNTSFKNIGSGLQFSNLHFPEAGIPKATGSLTTFTFNLDNSDDLPEKVYLKFTNVRPVPASGLSMVTDPNDPYHGWYWYSPATTIVTDLKNGNRYSPIVNLATQDATGIAEVWLEAPEYTDAYLKHEIPATGITISPNTTQILTLNSGKANDTSVQLTATVTPSNSTDVVTWTSSNTGVATVDQNGLVTAVATGSTTITATAGACSATVSVQVRRLKFINPGYSLTSGGTAINQLALGKDRDVYFTYTYVSGYSYPVTLRFTGLVPSDDNLRNNGDGTYTFTPRTGDTQYVHLKTAETHRFSAVSVEISQQYYDPENAFSLSRPTTLAIAPGNLVAGTRRPSTNNIMVYGYYTNIYDSSHRINNNYNGQYTCFNTNSPYASTYNLNVDLSNYGDSVEEGIVYFRYEGSDADGVYGNHDASATLADLIDSINAGQSYTLNFWIFVTGVSLNRTTAYVAPGRSLNLVATVSPSGASNSSVSWSSSNTSVATVDNNGVVTVSSNATVGSTATITVTTHEGGYTASCVVTVKRWAFTGGFSGSVFYGNGWSATYTLTIPADYEMPSGGIDIELALTNIIPDDSNITESGGKYYYHATSTGNKTLSFRTSGDRTGTVSVGLSHNDFNPATITATRSYINIAARGINMTSSTRRLFSNETAYVYSNKSLNTQLVSFATSRNGNYDGYNTYAVSFTNKILDASSKVYFKVGSEYAASTAEQMVNGETIAFSNTLSGRKEVTINTTSENYSTSDKTETKNGVTVEFSSLYQVQYNRLDMSNPSTVTVSVENGYHLVSVVFNYFRSVGTTYYPGSYSINSGGGTYVTGGSNNTTGTWTPSNNSTSSVTLNFSGNGNNRVAISSVSIVAVDD